MISRPILILALLLSFSVLSAQERTAAPDSRFHKDGAPSPERHVMPDQRDRSLAASTSPDPQRAMMQLPDTLNFPLQGQYALYTFGGGYVSGNNSYGDRAKASVFQYGSQSLLTGVLIDFAVATSNSIDIEVAAWDNSGTGGSPGSKIAGTTIALDDIFIDVLNDQTTYIPFEPPVLMTPTFYVGVVLPDGADTVAIFTNFDGDPAVGTAWEQWNTGQWFPYDDDESWGYVMDHAIFPIVDPDVGLIANFFADPAKLKPGESTTFFDSSIGEPVSWTWSFEGGTPASSTEESPTVTYAEEGLYDVTLVVSDGTGQDTLTREDYILVSTVIPVVTDTLNYPLEGIYTLYSITGNGGYICGNNLFNDLAKANYFSSNDDLKITGMLVDFAVATGGNPQIEMAIWNNNGAQGGPGTKLASESVDMNTIKSNLANNMMTEVVFDQPVILNHPFYAGFVLPTDAGDTLAVWSNEDGDTFPGTAWDLWEDNNWVAIADASSWGMNISMAIHPVAEVQTGLFDRAEEAAFAVSPNPGSGLLVVEPGRSLAGGTLEVRSLQGELLGNFPIDAGRERQTLDLSHLPAGVYLLVLTGDRSSSTRKIILR